MINKADILAFANDAVGTPFEAYGRSGAGWDCWGLCYVAYRDLLNVVLPGYESEYDQAIIRKQIASIIEVEKSAHWAKVEQPRPLDVALLKIGTLSCHVGLVIDNRYMLHVFKKTATCIEDYKSILWKGRIEGFYRYVG